MRDRSIAATAIAAAEEQQQRERREREAMFRRKENSSANASSEVKQKLQVNIENLSGIENVFELNIIFSFLFTFRTF